MLRISEPPKSLIFEVALSTWRTISLISGNLAFFSSTLGFTNVIPSPLRVSMFSFTALYMELCMDGTIKMGVLYPKAVIKRVLIGLSAIL